MDQIVTATDTFFAHPVFHDLADNAALGMPEDEARPGNVLDGEEVKLLAKEAMVAARGFFETSEMFVHLLL